MRRAALIVLDGVGIGPAPDTDQYDDSGSDTLGNVSRASGGLSLPHLEALGLGCCAPLAGVRAVDQPQAAWGIAQPIGAGEASTTGHWGLCVLVAGREVQNVPHGFTP